MILVVSMPVRYGRMSLRTLIAITTSSSAVLPARSPRPLIVHSICRAPASTAARALAVAMPRSLWQWVAKITVSAPGTRSSSIADQLRAFARGGIADGVGDVDRGRPGLDRDLDHAAEIIVLGPGGVHRRPLHVVAEVAGMGHGVVDALGHLVHGQVRDRAVQRRGADEGVDARAVRVPHRLPAAVDVLEVGAGQAADHRVLGAFGDLADTASKSPSEAIGKPGLDDVDAHLVEQRGDLQLFVRVMVAPGDCSPSRRVVSKIRTWSCLARVGHGFVFPLNLASARALVTSERRAPRARSEAAKKQQAGKGQRRRWQPGTGACKVAERLVLRIMGRDYRETGAKGKVKIRAAAAAAEPP